MRSRLAVLTLTVVVGVAAAGTVGIAYAVHPFHHVVDASWAEAYPTVEEMTQHADAVVSGHVVAEQGTETRTQDPSLIYTNFAFQVDTWIAGKPSGSVVLLHQMGGASGFTSSEAKDDPIFTVGEHDLLFLKMYGPGKYFVLGCPTGRLPVHASGTVTTLPASLLPVSGAPDRQTFIAQLTRIAQAQGKAS